MEASTGLTIILVVLAMMCPVGFAQNKAFFWVPPLLMYLSSSYSASLAPLVPSPQNCSVEFHGMACRTPRCSPRSTATRCTLSSTPPGRLCTAAPTTPPPSRRGALCTTSPTAPHLPSVYPGDLPLICRVGHTPDPSRSTVRSTNPSSLREVPERIVRTCSAFSFARAFFVSIPLPPSVCRSESFSCTSCVWPNPHAAKPCKGPSYKAWCAFDLEHSKVHPFLFFSARSGGGVPHLLSGVGLGTSRGPTRVESCSLCPYVG